MEKLHIEIKYQNEYQNNKPHLHFHCATIEFKALCRNKFFKSGGKNWVFQNAVLKCQVFSFSSSGIMKGFHIC